jgi:hypothetical protein
MSRNSNKKIVGVPAKNRMRAALYFTAEILAQGGIPVYASTAKNG